MIKKLLFMIIGAFGFVGIAYTQECLIEEIDISPILDCKPHISIDYFKVCFEHQELMMGYSDTPSIVSIYPQFFVTSDQNSNLQDVNIIHFANEYFSLHSSDIVSQVNFINFFTYESPLVYHVGIEMSYGVAHENAESFYVDFPLTHLLSFYEDELIYSHVMMGGVKTNSGIIREYLCANG